MDEIDVVLASNRGPVSFTRSADGFDIKRGAGGLSGALHPVAQRLGDHATWIATVASSVDREAVAAGQADSLSARLGYRVCLLDIAAEIYADYYDVVANRMLWFANHCLWDEVGTGGPSEAESDAWDRGYERVNKLFADTIAESSAPRALVFLQDYHLGTAAKHLRARRSQQPIAHFTHSSFCGPPGLRPLPEPIATQFIEGMLGADLLGFHVRPWGAAFLDSAEDLGYAVNRGEGWVLSNGRRVWVRSYPIPIDAQNLRKRAAGDRARSWASRFRTELGDETVVIARADRIEPSKNIVRGFLAFERLLADRPDLGERCHFVACLYPSREALPEYKSYAEAIKTCVSNINGRYPGAISLYMEDDFDRTLGALLEYDVLLVNPIMDGMNLVAKEGPAINQRHGSVVLSQRAGSFEELNDAVLPIHDPLDIDETARSIVRAIELAHEERVRRSEVLRGLVEARAPEDWIGPQIEDLRSIAGGSGPLTSF